MIHFILNDQTIETAQPTGMTVLDFVRYHQHLKGTKIGCREGDCGACTVLVGSLKDGQMHYESMTSCLMPLGNAQGKHIVTVEGLNMKELTPVQNAIVAEGGTQCGFCTVGFVVSLTGFTMTHKNATYQDAVASMDGNICRCTGYKSLERAGQRVTELLKEKDDTKPLAWLVKQGFLPEYFTDVSERLTQLHRQNPANGKAANPTVYVGGGTDLFVQRPEEMHDAAIAHVFGKDHLKGIYEKDGYCYIGASDTAEDMQCSELMQKIFPEIRAHVKLVSSTPIRNMGTIAGNLVNASPIGDLTIFFLALDSEIHLNLEGEKRWLKLKDFYLDYKKLDKVPMEHIEALRFEIPDKTGRFNFEKVCKRTHLDIASVNSACLIDLQDGIIRKAHISAGGVGPTPKYLRRSSAALQGKEISPALIQEVAEIIQEEISPISDARGTADYKRLLLRQLFFAHMLQFFPERLTIDALI